jgi:osmotically-inducible protein OsmY
MLHKYKIIALALGSCMLLQGCAALFVGAGIGAASAAHDRRTLGAQVDDQTTASRISIALGQNEQYKDRANINVHVFNGATLLVGQAPSQELINQIQHTVEQVENIGKLHNQIRLRPPIPASTTAHDVWLASKIKTILVADKRIDGLHVHVAVEDSEVFLMGLVSQSEANIAVDITRNVEGVSQVIKAFEYL